MRSPVFLAALLCVLLVLVQSARVCRVASIKPSNLPSNTTNGLTPTPNFVNETNKTVVPSPWSDAGNNKTRIPGTNGTTLSPGSTTGIPTSFPTPSSTNSTGPTNTTKVPTKTPKATPSSIDDTPSPTVTTISSLRRLDGTTKVVTTGTPTLPPTTTPAPSSVDDETPTPTSTGSVEPTSVPSTTPTDPSSPTTNAPTTTSSSPQWTPTPFPSGTSSNSSNSTALIGDIVCDEQFYGKWLSLNITCNELSLDVPQAVAAASCFAYSDASTCRSLCSLPSCDGKSWSYGTDKGYLSDVYRSVDFSKLLPSQTSFSPRSSGFNGGFCQPASSSTNVQECGCSTSPSSDNPASGNKDSNGQPDYGTFRPPSEPLPQMSLSQSTATATIAVTTVAVVSSTVMGSTTAATTAVASSSAMLVTLDIVQFGSLLNQLPLREKTEVLSSMSTQMKYAVFNFFEIGPGEPILPGGRHLTANNTSTCSNGICQYAMTIGISKYNLFVTTLVGILLLCGGLLFLYCIVAGIATLVVPSRGYASEWFNHLIGGMVVLGLASQYAIGVTGTYQIYLSYQSGLYLYSFYLSIISLLFLAIGILIFGIYIIRKYENELIDVEKINHQKKPVNLRYGALYDEYTFENRFFFAPKMLLALLCGMTTGAAFLDNSIQVILILIFHILFLVHLERCQPFQTPFMQHTMSLIMVMKILTLVLSIFLLTSVSGLTPGFHDTVSHIIVGIQLLVLVGLMIRQVVLLYQKYKAMQILKKQEIDDSALKPLSAEQVEHMKLGRL